MDGNLTVLHELLESHSNINLEVNDNNGQTPLNIAARHGYLEVVEVLKKNMQNSISLTLFQHVKVFFYWHLLFFKSFCRLSDLYHIYMIYSRTPIFLRSSTISIHIFIGC